MKIWGDSKLLVGSVYTVVCKSLSAANFFDFFHHHFYSKLKKMITCNGM